MIARAIEHAGLFHRHLFARRHQHNLVLVGRPGIKSVRLVAHGDPRPAGQSVTVVIDHLLPRSAVNHRLIAFDTGSFFAFISGDGDSAELDAFYYLVGFGAKLFDLNAVKFRRFEGA